MKSSDVFKSQYVTAADLQGMEKTLAMASCVMEDVKNQTGQADRLPVLYFRGAQKGMILNRTNWTSIANLYGDDSDSWVGREITLYPTMTQFGGKEVPCIRMRPPGGQNMTPPPAQTAVGAVQSTDPQAPLGNEQPDDPFGNALGGDSIPF